MVPSFNDSFPSETHEVSRVARPGKNRPVSVLPLDTSVFFGFSLGGKIKEVLRRLFANVEATSAFAFSNYQMAFELSNALFTCQSAFLFVMILKSFKRQLYTYFWQHFNFLFFVI